MKLKLQKNILLLSVITTVSCSSYKVTTISDIEDIDSGITNNVSLDLRQVTMTEDIVIEKYRGLLKEDLTEKNKKQVIRRYGDLLIDKGERLIVSDNTNNYRLGKEMILDSVNTYKIYINKFPYDKDNDYIYYQISRGYELVESPDIAYQYLTYLTDNYPGSEYYQEAQFRRGEYLFTRHQFSNAGHAYQSILGSRYQNTKLYNKTVYKYAWVNFKQDRFQTAITHFTALLDQFYKQGYISDYEITDKADKGNKESIKDILRAVSLSFSYMGGSQYIRNFTQNREYSPLLYSSLAKLYENKKRFYDAIDTYNKFIDGNKNSRHAYKFHQNIISLYKTAGITNAIIPEKVKFINNFGPGTEYQKNIAKDEWDNLNKTIEQNVTDLASYFHANAKGKDKSKNAKSAEKWYRYYLTHYSSSAEAPKLNFRLAELLNDQQEYEKAITEYDRTAYNYKTKDAKSAYAGISLYEKVKRKDHRWRNQLKAAHIRFYTEFGNHQHANKVLLKAAKYQFEDKEYPDSYASSSTLVRKQNVERTVYASAILIYAHSSFELEKYQEAEVAYNNASRVADGKLQSSLRDKAAASAYLFAKSKISSDPKLAVSELTRVGTTYKGSEIANTASFDAASLLMKQNDNSRAEAILVSLKNSKGNGKGYDEKNLHEKLAYIYLNNNQYNKAANEFVYIYNREKNTARKREILLSIADLYKKGGSRDKALKMQKEYVKVYKTPLSDYATTTYDIATYYKDSGNLQLEKKWLNEIIKLSRKNQKLPPDVNHYVAKANLRYAYFEYQVFAKAKLTRPLKKTLKKKIKLMKNVLKKYDEVINVGEFDLTTEATYNIANTYYVLSKDILGSQRPNGLSDEEYEQYTIILEDQAFPFEEKSIDIHTKNISLVQKGGINKWVSRSLDTLRKIQPARYGKQEDFVPYVE